MLAREILHLSMEFVDVPAGSLKKEPVLPVVHLVLLISMGNVKNVLLTAELVLEQSKPVLHAIMGSFLTLLPENVKLIETANKDNIIQSKRESVKEFALMDSHMKMPCVLLNVHPV